MNVAFIPVRGGSKSIPLKNIKELAGKPLVCWVLEAACSCGRIDRVYVATDSSQIKDTIEHYFKENKFSGSQKIEIIGRSEETATDDASTESAMLEFAKNYQFSNIALIQATSPLLRGEDLKKGFQILESVGTDSVLSVVRQKRFLWEVDEQGRAASLNYNIFQRPRRQDFDGYLVENGAFYITSRADLLRTQNRISGNIKVVEMDEDTFIEIDEPADWQAVEKILSKYDREERSNECIKS